MVIHCVWVAPEDAVEMFACLFARDALQNQMYDFVVEYSFYVCVAGHCVFVAVAQVYLVCFAAYVEKVREESGAFACAQYDSCAEPSYFCHSSSIHFIGSSSSYGSSGAFGSTHSSSVTCASCTVPCAARVRARQPAGSSTGTSPWFAPVCLPV